jgi:hypothetical protein
MMKTIPDPPAFLPLRGGGGPKFHMHLYNGHDRGARINGARAAPPFSVARCLTSVGPPPIISYFLPPFPCCRVSPIHLLLPGPHGLTFFSPPTRPLPRVPLLSMSASHPKVNSFLPYSSFSLDVFLHQSSFFILLSSRHNFHALIARPHHPRHVPPRWPPCPFAAVSLLFHVAARRVFYIPKC